MQSLKAKLIETVTHAEGLINDYNAKAHDLSEIKLKQDQKEKDLLTLKQELNDRQEAIVKQESLLMTRQQLDEMRVEINDGQAELENKKMEFERYRVEIQKEIDDKLASIEIWNGKLQEAEKALDEEKKIYKQRVIVEVEKAHANLKMNT